MGVDTIAGHGNKQQHSQHSQGPAAFTIATTIAIAICTDYAL
jgi:hypothetical protein